MGIGMRCPYCKNDDKVVKRGKRKNKFVKKQQYWCKDSKLLNQGRFLVG